ncbi:MAG TPA: SDR family oxidoreductase [Steroidobacteraceae bacterium]|nr:SDR family oxidoreductase [Steroidobacteraceae bacterium]
MQYVDSRKRFQERVVIVTGAGNGIGRGAAIAFAQEGATVYGVDLDPRGLEATQQCIRHGGGEFVGLPADVAEPATAARSVEQILQRSGRADVLVNNAGINMAKRIGVLEVADWDKVFATNLRSAYLFSKAVWPTFQRQNAGVILNIASIMGQVGGVGAPAYCATKSGILMLSRCLAKDGAPHGIRVNAVCPGYIDTPIMDRALQAMPDPQSARRELVGRMPLGRMGTPDDIAAALLFLASAEAGYISGAELTIDGAVTATQID